MKKVLLVLNLLVLFLPMTVKANIVCNDGTLSKSCLNCHSGCCSGHGGCTNTPNSKSSSVGKTTTKKVNVNSNEERFDLLIIILVYVASSIIAGLIASSKNNRR